MREAEKPIDVCDFALWHILTSLKYLVPYSLDIIERVLSVPQSNKPDRKHAISYGCYKQNDPGRRNLASVMSSLNHCTYHKKFATATYHLS